MINMAPNYRERFELAKESFTLDREDLKELFNSSKRESDIVSKLSKFIPSTNLMDDEGRFFEVFCN
jgi:hypothetical protein